MTLPALTIEDRRKLVRTLTDLRADPKRVAQDLRAGKLTLDPRPILPAMKSPDFAAWLKDITQRLAGEIEQTAAARTLEDLEGAGFTHLSIWCGPCRTTYCKPIAQFPPRTRALTCERLTPRLRCQACGTAPESGAVAPWRASDAPGHPRPRSAA